MKVADKLVKRSTIVSLRTVSRMPFQEIANNCQISASTARKIVQRAEDNAAQHEGSPLDAKNLADRPKSGRPSVTTERDERMLIHTATRSKVNRLKPYKEL